MYTREKRMMLRVHMSLVTKVVISVVLANIPLENLVHFIMMPKILSVYALKNGLWTASKIYVQ